MLLQLGFGLLALGDVVVDAEHPDHVPRRIAERHLGGTQPYELAIRRGLGLFKIES